MIFAAFIRIRLKRHGAPGSNGSKTLLYLVTANFIACTAFLAVCAVTVSQSNAVFGVAPDALYTCVDLISQVILVNLLTYDSVSTVTTDCDWLSLFNKDLPLLDLVARRLAPTMGYGCPDPVNTCILRCQC
jgi:hypothetical protein